MSYLRKECLQDFEPTLKSIKEDFEGWPRVNTKIREAKGAMVPDENFRSGRRVIRIDGKKAAGELRTTRARKRDRISMQDKELLTHPSLKEAEAILLGGVSAVGAEAVA